MTLHAFIEHKCSYCGTHFVPLPILPRCPKCGRKSSKVFDNFIEDTIRSSLYNLTKYGSFVPPGWGTFTVGDHYYWLAFGFLSFASSSLKIDEKELFSLDISENTAQKLALTFLDKLDFGKQEYMANALKPYFIRLLCSPKDDRIVGKTQPKVTCFLSHCSSDKVFCDKLYSDLVASGVKCWYFPEDAIFGKEVWGEIDKSIYSCNKVIVICSINSLQSAPVLREIERALQREDAEGKDILLPLRIDDYVLKKWVHPRRVDVIKKVIGDFQKWRNKEKYRESLQRLNDAIKR